MSAVSDGTTPEVDLTALVAAFGRDQLERNGVPDAAATADRGRCHEVLSEAFAGGAGSPSVRVSPLGVAWTDVFAVHLHDLPARQELLDRGWLPLSRVAGSKTRWAVIEDGRVLGAVQLHRSPPVDPVAEVVSRCRAQGEVRLRDMLELCELRVAGGEFPPTSPVLRSAADVESGLGGRRLAPWASGRPATAPSPLGGAPRGRRLVVAISGVDGSGKSTLHRRLSTDLARAGVGVSTVWVRPGMGLGPLVALAAQAKRLLRQDPAPGIRAVSHQDGAHLASRRGAVGWIWALLVCLSFLAGVWRQHRAARGPVTLYDRHLVDALATLDFAYEGVDLRLHRRLVRLLLPRADLSVYLDVPADVSVSRKPDDVIGATAVRRQLAAYDHWLRVHPPTLRLDATRAPEDLGAETVRWCLTGGSADSPHHQPQDRDLGQLGEGLAEFQRAPVEQQDTD